MRTRVLAVDPARPEAGPIAEAARTLLGGGLVAFPTETVYGLGGRVADPEALARIFAAKGRPATHPIIAHVLDEAGAAALAAAWPLAAATLARAFWPGPLTLVVERAAHVPAAVGGGTASIGLRAPAHPVARALLAALGESIGAPSANRYQGLSPTRASHVLTALDGKVDLILDGGTCERGIESTVIDARTSPPAVLRPGSIDGVALAAVVPGVTYSDATTHAEGVARASPGQDVRHYAPRAPLSIAPSREAARATAISRAARGDRVGLVLLGAAPDGEVARPGLEVLTLPGDAAGYARALYAALHDLDARSVDAIVVEAVPREESWRAVTDRLERAQTR